MKVYVNDVLVKIQTTQQLAFDLQKVLEILSRIRGKFIRYGRSVTFEKRGRRELESYLLCPHSFRFLPRSLVD